MLVTVKHSCGHGQWTTTRRRSHPSSILFLVVRQWPKVGLPSGDFGQIDTTTDSGQQGSSIIHRLAEFGFTQGSGTDRGSRVPAAHWAYELIEGPDDNRGEDADSRFGEKGQHGCQLGKIQCHVNGEPVLLSDFSMPQSTFDLGGREQEQSPDAVLWDPALPIEALRWPPPGQNKNSGCSPKKSRLAC